MYQNKINCQITFEKAFSIIEEEINKRKGKWVLSVGYMDWDDVAQILKNHIWKKWDRYNPKLPLRHWVSRVSSNQIKNLIRNNYAAYQSPCVKCEFNLSDNGCRKYGEKSTNCEPYKIWTNGKKNKLQINMADSLDAPPPYQDRARRGMQGDIKDVFFHLTDISHYIPEFNKLLKKKLTTQEWEIYDYLYLQNLSEEEVKKLLGYKHFKTNRYKQICKIKNKIYEKAKKIANEIEYYE